VHINVVAVPVSAQGNFRLYPANIGPPIAGLLNYKAGVQNIANAGTFKTFFSVGAREIEIQNRVGTAHLVIDVMGYYHEADKDDLKVTWVVPENVKLTNNTHNGNFGGYQAMNSWIQSHGCPGYHVCDYTEVSRWLQTVGTSVFSENAWINSPGVYGATGNVGDCRGWSPIAGDVGTIIARSAGKTFPGRHFCDRFFRVACCK
jgi:hypothetical protein